MKALVGVDGSECGFAAAEFIGRLLSAERDRLILYYSPPEVSVRSLHSPSDAIVKRARFALAESVFAETRKRLPSELTEVTERIVGEKKPVDGLLIVSDSKQVDLIVVGARGASSLERLVLGSVSRSVVHGTSLPILVVRKSSKPTTDSAMQVLLACDRSEKSRAAAKLMQNLSWPEGTTGRVMTVNESLFANQVPDWLEQQARETDTEAMAKAWVEEHDAELEGLGEEMSELCTELPSIFRQRPPIVTEGHPAKQILQIIDQEQTDLVVVGARGLGPVKRLLLGSTSEHLLSHAPCSILIVRNQATP